MKAAGAAITIWFILFFWKRYVSLASLGMAVTFPIWIALFYSHRAFFLPMLFLGAALTIFIFYTHRSNIQRLREGLEKRLF